MTQAGGVVIAAAVPANAATPEAATAITNTGRRFPRSQTSLCSSALGIIPLPLPG
jgi:hypothetical protein